MYKVYTLSNHLCWYLQNGQILTVTLVTLSDEGVYKCLAENAAGTTDRIIDVDIHGKFVMV